MPNKGTKICWSSALWRKYNPLTFSCHIADNSRCRIELHVEYDDTQIFKLDPASLNSSENLYCCTFSEVYEVDV